MIADEAGLVISEVNIASKKRIMQASKKARKGKGEAAAEGGMVAAASNAAARRKEEECARFGVPLTGLP